MDCEICLPCSIFAVLPRFAVRLPHGLARRAMSSDKRTESMSEGDVNNSLLIQNDRGFAAVQAPQRPSKP